jgi:Fur family ferric uptake transcriptional regulator
MSESKQYKTRQRAELLSCMKEAGSTHFTAADIASRMHERGSTVGLTTIYRLLDKLVEQGQLRRFILGNTGAACYQLVSSGVSAEACRCHYHLKCEKCGRLIHAECAEIDGFTKHMRIEHGFTINHAKTVFYGICEACMAERKE